MTQEEQVIQALKDSGGYATLRRLNESVDFSNWGTKTPEASVRRIVQQSRSIFKIRPGLWALEESRAEVCKKLGLYGNDSRHEEIFSHAYYQGLLVEIGKYKRMSTFVPAQDKSRLYLETPLGELADQTTLPDFTYEEILRKAKTVDVIWMNERRMPSSFFEVEHTTDIRNSLCKFYELQDFHSNFFIVADNSRRAEFEDKLASSIFSPIQKRVRFLKYDDVVSLHSGYGKMAGIFM